MNDTIDTAFSSHFLQLLGWRPEVTGTRQASYAKNWTLSPLAGTLALSSPSPTAGGLPGALSGCCLSHPLPS